MKTLYPRLKNRALSGILVLSLISMFLAWNVYSFAAERVIKAPAVQTAPKTQTAPPQTTPVTPQQQGIGPMGGQLKSVPITDLAVTEIDVLEIGEGAVVRVTVKNVGTERVDANLYRLQILLDGSRPGFLRSSGSIIKIANAGIPIEAGQSRKTGFVPKKSGRTSVRADLIAMPPGKDDNRNNNTLTRTLNLPEVLPDFKVKDVSLTGDNLVRATIHNSGGYAPAGVRGKLDVYVEGRRMASMTLNRWPNPNETITIYTTVRIEGQKNVRATVNPDRAVQEVLHDNNTLGKTLTAAIFKPDLRVKNLSRWRDSSDRAVPVTKLIIVLENPGRAASPRTLKADVFIEGQLAQTLTLTGPIDKQAEKRFDTAILMERTKEYRVTVDPLNVIDEEREHNNSRTETLSALTAAELHPNASLVSSGEIPARGEESVFRSVPCSTAWPFVRVRVSGLYFYKASGGGFGGISDERAERSAGDESSMGDAEGPLTGSANVWVLINGENLMPYNKSGNYKYDYMLQCTRPMTIRLKVNCSNCRNNGRYTKDPLRSDIYIPSAADVRQAGLRVPGG